MQRYFLIFLFLLASPLHSKESVCLAMIVKNEAESITRSLDSVKPLIDYWVIVDTGSTDGTQEIIKKHMKGIPGKLYERPWKNFAHNRTEAMDLARAKGDYVLVIDADDWLEYKPGFRLPPLTKDAYQMWLGSDSFVYLKPQLFKSTLPWKYIGVTHEYVFVDRPFTQEPLDGVKYKTGTGSSYQDLQKKFARNIQLLEEGLKEEPTNSRYMFYLAESYRDFGDSVKAIDCYLKRVDMGGWEEEVFCSLLQIAKLEKQLNVHLDVVAEAFAKAHRLRPHRPEPIYYLAELYNQHDRHALAYECLKGWHSLPKKSQRDILFNEIWTEEWGLDFQLSIAAYHLGKFQESLALCDALLGKKLPAIFKERTEANRLFALEKNGLASK